MKMNDSRSNVREIDVIFGAHTHHLFPEGEFVGPVLLAATGKYGDYVGQVTLQIRCYTKEVTEKNAMLYRTDQLEHTESDIEKVKRLYGCGQTGRWRKKCFSIRHHCRKTYLDGSALSSFFGRALMAYTNADCALFNAGIFLGSLDKGWVTKGDLHALLPHPINPCIVTLDGGRTNGSV